MATFTKILINSARRQGRKLLTNPQALHAAVCASFPPDIDQRNGRILWRLDQRGHENILYIVGPEKPTAVHIVEQAGWDTRPPQSADYDRFLGQLMRGQQWGFELVANPTKSLQKPGGRRGQVVARLSATSQLEWLHSKAESMGVTFGSLKEGTAQVVGREPVYFNRKDSDHSHFGRVHIVRVRFQGRLEVTEPDRLRQTLVNGVGRAKGYGCGLLTLARISASAS